MWKKKVSIAVLSVMMLFGTAVSASAAQQNVSVKVDSKRVSFPDAQPYFESSRVMIPVRFVSESLGAKVSYGKESSGNKVKRVVTIKLGDKVIYMTVNSSKVLVGEQIITLDVPARLQEERVYVPLRFVSEALGTQVKWNQAQKLVSISTGAEIKEPEPDTEVDNMYGDFQFKDGFDDLAKALFINNAKVTNGKLTFTVPKGATATYWTNDMASTKLVSGKTYTYALGGNKGSISINLVYPGKNEQEGYSLFLDSKVNADMAAKFGSITDDAIVALATNKGIGATTLTKVILAAKEL